jgi:hypothetical protein
MSNSRGNQMKAASYNIPGVRSIKIGYATRLDRAHFFEVLGLPDPLPPETRPLLMTPEEARRYGLSRSTVDRMIAAGRAAEAENNAA